MSALNLSAIDPVATASAHPTKAYAQEVASMFEQVFIQQMVENLKKTSLAGEGGGMFGDSTGSSTYDEWFDSNLSEHMARNGGIGIKDVLMREFEKLHAFEPQPETQAQPQPS